MTNSIFLKNTSFWTELYLFHLSDKAVNSTFIGIFSIFFLIILMIKVFYDSQYTERENKRLAEQYGLLLDKSSLMIF